MIGRDLIEEDLELKRFATAPRDQKPNFDWGRDAAHGGLATVPGAKVEVGAQRIDFDLAHVAETVGDALTDLLLSRKEEDIFTQENRQLVATIARAVAEEIAAKADDHGGENPTFSTNDISGAIEAVLIKHNEHDVARSLVMRRHARLVRRLESEARQKSPARNRTVRVIRRTGEVVAWNASKVEIAVRKAFLSLHLDSEPAAAVAAAVTDLVTRNGQDFIHIEDLQDRVQEELMRQGYYKVAEAYILYRAHRAAQRADDLASGLASHHPAPDPDQQSLILIKTPDGKSFFWDGLDLKKRIDFALIGLDVCLAHHEIEEELRRSLFEEMTLAELNKTIVLNAKSLIERDADFGKFAGRILLSYIYEEVTGWDIVRDGIEALPTFHRRAFKANLSRGIEIGRLSPRLRDFDLDRLAEALDPSADLDFDYLGIQTLFDRYLIVDKTGAPHRRLETPQLFWMRVSMGLFIDAGDDQADKVIGLYKMYKSRRFCSSTPTLFNSGTLHSQLSSCYLYKIDDSIESIMIRGIAENAFLSKWAGGLGGSWTSVRGTGSYIHGTNGESQGVIPFLKLHNDQLVAVNQGGKRRGSGCAYLESWHNDIFDFLELRKNTGDDRRRTHDMNTANWIPDLFMKRMEEREAWTLFRSSEAPDLHGLYGKAFETRYLEYEAMAARGEMFGKSVPAIDLWKSMLRLLFETGHPWITFKDACNIRSPQDHVGVIHSSNLCTEITLNTSADETAVCNLGSIVLDTHLDARGEIDHEKLRETVHTAVRALDNVIDINFYPTEAARRANMRHRPVGLGVMGLQNALYIRGASFASDEAVEFNDEFMEAIAYYAYEASSELAAEKGTYSTYQGSKWDRGLLPGDTIDLLEEERGVPVEVPRGGKLDWDALRAKIARQGMRNSNVLAIAPTATISNIMGTTPCIEPTYKNLFVKSNLSGDFIVLNPFLVRDLKDLGLWDREMLDRLKYYDGELAEIAEIPEEIKEKYLTAFNVPYQYLIDAAARRQKWIDQSQSVNLFLAHPDMKTLSHMYRAAWRAGLKTTYYLRTLGASNIEKATVSVKKEVRGFASQQASAAAASGAGAGAAMVPESEVATVPATTTKAKDKGFTAQEAQACSLEAMLNGTDCEACQ